MSQKPQTFDLTPFCDAAPCRYNLETPWVDNGWEYATNRRVCVRQPTTASPPDDGTKRPKCADFFQDFPPCVNDWPEHDGAEVDAVCPECGGSGRVRCTCPDCKDEHRMPCEECAQGIAQVKQPQVIAGRKIASAACLKIQALGQVKYCVQARADGALAFSCGKLQGLVMPLGEEET